MRQILLSVLSVVLMCSTTSFGQEKVSDVLRDRSVDWRKPSDRAMAAQRMRAAKERNLERAKSVARKKGKPIIEELPGGKIRWLDGIDDSGELSYYETKNVDAAISTAADKLHIAPYQVDGEGLRVGVWENRVPRVTHQEFNDGPTSRINNMDGLSTGDHATHVAGTIAAAGVSSNAKGMAFKAEIDSYRAATDEGTMAGAGATAPGQFGTKVYVSNHSYGPTYGWVDSEWKGTGTDQNAYDPNYGQYSDHSVDMDTIAYNAPYYLIFWAAGNENTDGPNNGNTVEIGGSSVTYNSAIHPPKDGLYRNGFETVGDEGVAKNLIAVGAANDAETGGQRDPSKATKAGFSSTGPSDDGRIKPDLMGNGVGVYSSLSSSDTAYGNLQGTSMATPNLTGTAALLVDLYRDLFSGGAMRSSTLKGLLIHTATDLGNPGPDYTYGWGLVDAEKAAELLQRQADFPNLESVVEDQLSTAQPSQSYTFSWDGISEIRVTLCWTDPPGPDQNSLHDDRTPDLVNDLNVKLIAPDGTEYFPFVMPFVGTWTVASMSQNATTGVNHTDNVEQILIESPGQAGAWQVEVTHVGSLTNDVQDYGLLISGAGTAGSLVFDSSNFSVNENAGTATITVNRVAGTTGAVSVDYATSDDTAVAGSDYTPTSGTLNWADEDGASKSFTVPITNDGTSETYEERVFITLSNPTGGISVGGTNPATLTIVDDEPLMGITSPNGGEVLPVDTAQTITWSSSLGGSVKIELYKNGILYQTLAGNTANDGSFGWNIPPSIPNGSDYRIAITSLVGGGEFDDSNGDFTVENLVNVDIYTADMSTDPGWTLEGDWAYGKPTGNAEDPSKGHTGDNVIGYNLSGDYANDMSETYATTAAIDCSEYIDIELSFYRDLAVESSTYDNASIRVSNNGTTWTTVWAHSGGTFDDSSWVQQTYDISEIADGEPTVYVRWVMGSTDGSVTFGGWNIDDVVISGLGDGYVNPAGEVAFSSSSYSVAEDGGSATITIDRINGTVGAVSVDYSTSDGSATSGSDYSSTSGTLTWADGDSISQTFNVPITNDSNHEDFIETVTLTLFNVGGGAAIGDPGVATLEIQDDDNNAPTVDAGDNQTAPWQDVTPTPGLAYGTVSGSQIDITTPNPETQILVDVSSETENSIAENTTEIYTGFIYDADGQISFTEHIDDRTRIWIDGVLVLSDDAWRDRASTSNLDLEPNPSLAPGWHTIEIRIHNGIGGSGPQSSPGIGYDPAGGTNWQTLVDPGDGSFLKVNQNISGAQATLDGTVNDLDGDPVTTTWSLFEGPGSVIFDDASAVDTTASFDTQGVYTLRLTADDGRETVTDDVVITVAVPGLSLEIEQASILENGGTSNATVSRLSSAGDLVVNLSSNDTSEATVPAFVIIFDGETSADFTIAAADDALVDGTQTVTITASAVGNPDAVDTIDVTDDEVAILTLNIDAASIGESDGAGATTATVTRNSDTTNAIIVNLSSDDTSEADVQATVTIPAGQSTSPSFDIDAIDDSVVDGTRTVTLTASYSGHTEGTDTLDVTDDIALTLTMVTGAGGDSSSGGGTYDPDGSPYAISASPATGYNFVNWSVTSGTATVDDDNAINTFVFMSADATVQANFTPATYTVSYNGNGNDGGSVPGDQTKTHGLALTLEGQGDLVKTGYSFNGWNTAAGGTGDPYPADGSYTANAPATLYAQWAANNYTVTFDENGGSASDPATKPVTFDLAYGTLATTSRTGYSFIGWFTQATGGAKVEANTIVSTASDHTLYAQWADSLTWDANAASANQTNGGGAWLGTDQWWNGTANSDWVAGSNAVFGGPATNGGAVTLASPTTVQSITLNQFSGTYTLGTSGQAITLGGGITKNEDSGTTAIISPIILSGNQNWTNNSSTTLTTSNGANLIDNSGFDLTIDGSGDTKFGVINNSSPTLTGSGALTKNGSGRFSVGGVNSGLTGPVTVNGGVMQVNNNNEPMGSGNLTLNGGVIAWYWGATYSRTLGTGDNQVQIPGGESGFAGSGTTGPTINLGSSVVWGANGEGSASGYFNPSKFVLGDSGTGNAAATTFATGIDFNGTTRTIVVPKGLSSAGNKSIISGDIIDSIGTAGLIKEGEGTLVLNGVNTYTGDTVITGGTLQVGTNNLGNGASLNSGNYLGNINMANGATLHIQTNASQTLSGVISGDGGLIKSYNGTLILGDNNTYTGKTVLEPLSTSGAGKIVVSSFNSVVGGSASSSLGAPTTVENGTIDFGATGKQGGATIQYTGSGETTDRVINFLMNGTGAAKTIENAGSGLLKFTSTPTTSGSNTNDISLTGVGDGAFTGGLPFAFRNLTKSGIGTWTLGGTIENTGTTNINSGALVINGSISDVDATLTVNNGATLGGTGSIGRNVNVASGGKLEFDISTAPGSHDGLDIAAGRDFDFAGASELTITSSAGATTGTYTLVTGGNNMTGLAPATVNLPANWVAHVSISGNSLLLEVTSITGSTYTVTYDANTADSGQVPNDDNNPYADGATVTVLGNSGGLSKAGYNFVGWNTESGGGGTDYVQGNTFNIADDTTLYAQWAVKPAITITAASNSKDYDGAPLSDSGYSLSSGTLEPGHTLVSVTVTGSQTVAGSSDNVPGAARIENGSSEDVTGYYDITYANGTLTVNKATPTATLQITNSPVTYDGTEQSAVVAIQSSSVEGAVSNVTNGSHTDAGTYAVTADFVPTDTANYRTLTNLAAGEFVIAKAIPIATLEITNTPVTYDTTAQSAVVAIQSSSIDGTVANVTNGTHIDAGTYAVTADFVPDDAANYETLTGIAAGDFVIAKATPTASLEVTNTPVTYDGTEQSAVVTIQSSSVEGAVTNVANGAHTDAGTYAVTADFVPTDSTNYETLTDLAAGDFVIAKAIPTATLEITNTPVSYNSTEQSAVVAIQSSSVEGAVANVTNGAHTNAGTYAVTADFVPTDTANYETLTDLAAGDFVIEAATPTVNTWPSASNITLGQSLSDSTLSGGSASVEGSFAFTTPGTTPESAGTYSAAVNFIPSDTANYNSVAGTVDVEVLSGADYTDYEDYAGQNGGHMTDPSEDGNNNGIQDGVEYAFYGALGQGEKTDTSAKLAQILSGALEDDQGTPNNSSDDRLKYSILMPESPPSDVTYYVYASSLRPHDSGKTLLATFSNGSWTLEPGVSMDTGAGSQSVIVDPESPSTSNRRFLWLELEISGL
jgi:uncharacterized repeat protein (TIGR02543 family)